MMGYVYMHNCLFEQVIKSFLLVSQCNNAQTEGMNSYLAYYSAGMVCECMGRIVFAIIAGLLITAANLDTGAEVQDVEGTWKVVSCVAEKCR